MNLGVTKASKLPIGAMFKSIRTVSRLQPVLEDNGMVRTEEVKQREYLYVMIIEPNIVTAITTSGNLYSTRHNLRKFCEGQYKASFILDDATKKEAKRLFDKRNVEPRYDRARRTTLGGSSYESSRQLYTYFDEYTTTRATIPTTTNSSPAVSEVGVPMGEPTLTDELLDATEELVANENFSFEESVPSIKARNIINTIATQSIRISEESDEQVG